jgi:glucosamine--fructose-6-phosphate aminotransferase (isomerizing)
VALVSGNDTLLKILANIEEVKTRGARVVVITDTDLSKYDFDYVYHIPLSSQRHGYYKPIAFVIPLQIIAYEAASQLNLNIDRPRNLAKSVTVE